MASSMSGSRGYRDKVPSGYGVSRVQQYTPEQMKLMDQSMGMVSPDSTTARLAAGDEGMFQQLEAPAMKQFSSLQGNVASRFSGMGTGGRRSSGFQNTMTQAGQDFAGQLQSQRLNLTRQATQDLYNMSQGLLSNRPYETSLYEKPKKAGFDWMGLGGAALGAAGGFLAGGPMGAVAGASAGYNIGSGAGGQGRSVPVSSFSYSQQPYGASGSDFSGTGGYSGGLG